MSLSSIPHHLRTHIEPEPEIDRSCMSRFFERELKDLKSEDLWRAAVAEFVGCFLLVVFTVTVGLGYPGEEPSLLQVAIGCGFTLSVLITAFAKVSGGHVNPAISIGFLVTREITFCRFLIYSAFQTTGGITGAAFLKEVIPDDLIGSIGLLAPNPKVTLPQAFAAEATITFLLLFVTMSMLDKGRLDIQGSVPFMVGLTVTVNILYGAKISGGCMNPVRNFGPAVILGKFDNIWIYWLGPLLGGFLGALTYDWFFSTSPMGPARCKGRRRAYGSVGMDDDTKDGTPLRIKKCSDIKV